MCKDTKNKLLQYIDEKIGRFTACMPALLTALSDRDFCGYEFGIFDGRVIVHAMSAPAGYWEDLDNRHVTMVRIFLEENGFSRVKKKDVRDIIELVAKSHTAEPVNMTATMT